MSKSEKTTDEQTLALMGLAVYLIHEGYEATISGTVVHVQDPVFIYSGSTMRVEFETVVIRNTKDAVKFVLARS